MTNGRSKASNAAAAQQRAAKKQTRRRRWWHRLIDVQSGKLLVFGLEVGGWGGAVALILSCITLYFVAYDKFWVVPLPDMRGPEDVNFVCDVRQNADCMSGDNVYVRANPIILRNLAPGDHPFTVDTMDAAVDFLDASGNPVKQFCLDWQFFSNITTVGSEEDAAGPIQVRDSSPFSKEIEFYARRKYLPNGDLSKVNFFSFRDMEQMLGTGGVSVARLTFEAEILGTTTQQMTETCEIKIDADFQAHAAASYPAATDWEAREKQRKKADPKGESLPLPDEEYHVYSRECMPVAPQPPRCLKR